MLGVNNANKVILEREPFSFLKHNIWKESHVQINPRQGASWAPLNTWEVPAVQRFGT